MVIGCRAPVRRVKNATQIESPAVVSSGHSDGHRSTLELNLGINDVSSDLAINTSARENLAGIVLACSINASIGVVSVSH